MVDMAHYAGLVAGGAFPDPIPHAHVVTTTTHKTLRGPRGGMILTNDADLGIKKINSAVFPGLQGGPLEHVIAAKAVAFGEALQPAFKLTMPNRWSANAQALAGGAGRVGAWQYRLGRHRQPPDAGRPAAQGRDRQGRPSTSLEKRANMTCNKNGVPFDTAPFTDHLGRPPRHAGRHHARLQARPSSPADRRTGSPTSSTASPPTVRKAMTRPRPVREVAGRGGPGARTDPPLIPIGAAMKCHIDEVAPSAAMQDTQVKDSRPSDDGAAIRRRRSCAPKCNVALHHLRARATARAGHPEAQRVAARRSSATSWCARSAWPLQ
jgi:hypothetical protein